MPEEKLINRPEYLEKLIKWSADTTLIKIITGVRRCGKSKLLDLFKSHLLANGTSESQIHKIDLDLLENKWLHEPTALYNHILIKLCILGRSPAGQRLAGSSQQPAEQRQHRFISDRIKCIYVFQQAGDFIGRPVYRNKNATIVVQGIFGRSASRGKHNRIRQSDG